MMAWSTIEEIEPELSTTKYSEESPVWFWSVQIQSKN